MLVTLGMALSDGAGLGAWDFVGWALIVGAKLGLWEGDVVGWALTVGGKLGAWLELGPSLTVGERVGGDVPGTTTPTSHSSTSDTVK